MEYGTQNVRAHHATIYSSSRNATSHFSLFLKENTKKESITALALSKFIFACDT